MFKSDEASYGCSDATNIRYYFQFHPVFVHFFIIIVGCKNKQDGWNRQNKRASMYETPFLLYETKLFTTEDGHGSPSVLIFLYVHAGCIEG